MGSQRVTKGYWKLEGVTGSKHDGDGFEQKEDPLEKIQNIKERNDQSVQTAIRTPT